MKKCILSLVSVLLILACSKNDDSVEPEMVQADKVIFGGVYGMCGGDCRDLYLITKQSLYKDADNISDKYGDWANTSFEDVLGQEEFNNTENLLTYPSSLMNLDTSKDVIVQSRADVDYYLYIEKDGKTKELILDHIHINANPEIKSYFRKFLKNYKYLGGYMIDTTNVEKYY